MLKDLSRRKLRTIFPLILLKITKNSAICKQKSHCQGIIKIFHEINYNNYLKVTFILYKCLILKIFLFCLPVYTSA